jgi:D-serine deaminase-like pyridoxal phosphate-dependent protein
MHRARHALWAITFSTATAIASMASAGGFENIILSSEKDAKATEGTFAADTAKLFVSADLTDDVKSNSKINVAWIAVDTGGAAPANFKIDESNFDAGVIDNHIDASLSKPDQGWPVGAYKVILSVNGKSMESVDFSIK